MGFWAPKFQMCPNSPKMEKNGMPWVIRGLHGRHMPSINAVINVHLKVWMVTVSVSNWLAHRLAGPWSVPCLPSPRATFFSFRRSRVYETSVLVTVSSSCTAARTAGGSMIRVSRISADPVSTSALSLPRTPAWPGEKTHTKLSCSDGWLVLGIVHA